MKRTQPTNMIYIAILRGINVSGSKKLPMAELRMLLSNLDFEEVQTYIQSGNAVFKSEEKNQGKLGSQIAEAIKKQYDYDVPVLVKTIAQWKTAIANNPFTEEDISKQAITFLANKPEEKIIEIDSKDDRFEILNSEVYLYCPNGFGRSKLTNNLFERKLKTQATTRNWKTIYKLLNLAEAME
ncbi:DUF1697 domain-containing protein [uncultured Kordia sp.]|uniref:DUF1697 domain-containing protein n=1 Tax=uncultured Kordia sp. TaxID=507699 RepID=UPI00260C493D|nr:DUF1697 domain-containing protein [uncultured Kordia sp.]